MLCFCSNGHIVPVQMDTVCMILLDIERYRGHKLTSHLHSLVNIIASITLTAWLWSSFSWLWLIMTIQTVLCHFHDDANHIAMNGNHHNRYHDNEHYSHRCSSLLTATETRFAQYVAHLTNFAHQRGPFRGCPPPNGAFMESLQKRENTSFP